MSSTLLQRHICFHCRVSAVGGSRQQAWVSTTSSINRGLRATKDDGREKRGGRDRSIRARPPTRDAREARPPRPAPQDRRRLSAYTDTASDRPERRNFARNNDYTSRPGRQDYTRDRPSNPGRRERAERVALRDDSDGNSSRYSVIRSSRSEDTNLGFRGQPNSRAQPKPAEGLLKAIKNACRQIHFLQQQQESGENHSVDDLVRDARTSLKTVNSFITSGNFQEDEPAQAVVSLFHKKARAGTFLAGQMPDGKKSVIYVTRDGVIDLAVGRPEPGAMKAKPRPSDRMERSAEPVRHERREMRDEKRPARSKRTMDEDDEIPVSVPYTTAASEFLYGYNSVLAALKAQRRQLYKLYIHPKIFDADIGGQGTDSGQKPGSELVALAKEAGIPFRNEFKTAMLDKMSDGRPHNGVILEASKLPAVPVLGLRKPESSKGFIPIELGQQSAEEAKINGSPKVINSVTGSWRHPFVVLLDGITDPGNIGNIIRTCHFYGVDAIAVATNTCANLSSAVLAKASSGACEAMRLLSVSQPSNFVHNSSKYRWKVYAAVAPTGKQDFSGQFLSTSNVAADSPLVKHPCILMLGAEGEGLRQNLRNRADHFVSIEGGQRADNVPDVGVDSMNVGVATGVLLEAFMRKPVGASNITASDEEL
ncbi:putative 50S ribosomal protein L30e [Septoria linicola]|nr:putative 50S ribosomal protein L30e [Septoria linicola]